jgi:hypothetical protein
MQLCIKFVCVSAIENHYFHLQMLFTLWMNVCSTVQGMISKRPDWCNKNFVDRHNLFKFVSVKVVSFTSYTPLLRWSSG